MKTYNKAAALLLTLASGLFALQANAVDKIALVNKAAIFQNLAQASSIEADLAAEFKDRIDKVNLLKQDFDYYMAKQKKEAATLSETEKQEINKKLQSLGMEYQQTAKQLDGEMRQRQNEESNKLLVKIGQAIETFGKDGKYDLIIAREAVAYVGSDVPDVSEKVLEAINKK